MEEIGVSLLVKDLLSFQSDLSKADDSIQKLIPTSNLLGSAFNWLGGVVSDFVNGGIRVLEYTLGGLIKDGIEAVTSALGELITQTIDAGNEFQTMSIRLTGLNLPASKDDINDWTAALAEAQVQTKDELEWINLLSAITPFDPVDISNVYTMARAFGKTDEEARRLTKDITDFAAGMGLSSAATVNLMQNIGQIIERGKIMGQTIRNMTRSAFLPWDDMVTRMATDLGISKEALVKLISTAEGVPADVFIRAFEAMVEEEPRFIGAAGRLSRAFLPAVENIKQLISSVLGLNILKPILDVLGEHVAKVVDEFASFNEQSDLIKTDKWEKLSAEAKFLGEEFSSLVNDIINIFIPGTTSIADGMIKAISGLSIWIGQHKDDIVDWVKRAVDKIKELWDWLFGKEGQEGAIQKFFDWFGSDEVKNTVDSVKGWLQTLSDLIFGKASTGPSNSEKSIPGALQNIEDTASTLEPLLAPIITLLGTLVLLVSGSAGITGSGGLGDTVAWLVTQIGNLNTFLLTNKDIITPLIQAWAIAAISGFLLAAAIGVLAGFVIELTTFLVGLGIVFVSGLIMWLINGAIAIWNWITAGNNWLIVLYAIALAIGIVALAASGITLPILAMIAVIVLLGTIIWQNRDKIAQWAADVPKKFEQFKTDSMTHINQFVTDFELALDGLEIAVLAKIEELITGWLDYLKSNEALMEESGNTFVGRFIHGIVSRLEQGLGQILELIRKIEEAIQRLSGLGWGGGGGDGGGGGGGGGGTRPTPFALRPASMSAMSNRVIPASQMNQSMTHNSQYVLNIISSADREPIIQDFNMLASMRGN